MKSSCTKPYTLIELIVVIIIVSVVAFLGVVRLRKSPAFITLETQTSQVKLLLAGCQSAAIRKGEIVEVWFLRKQHLLQGKLKGDKKILNKAVLYSKATLDFKKQDLRNTNAEKVRLFVLFPDGTGVGRGVVLQQKNQRILLRVSPLTGAISSSRLKDIL